MAVVFHHTGSPKKTTTAQKERMAARRSHMLSLVSGGGDACALAACGAVAAATPEGSSPTTDADDVSAAFGGAIVRCSLFLVSGPMRTETLSTHRHAFCSRSSRGHPTIIRQQQSATHMRQSHLIISPKLQCLRKVTACFTHIVNCMALLDQRSSPTT